MPSFLADVFSESVNLEAGESSPYEPPHRRSNEKSSFRSGSSAGTGSGGLSNGAAIGAMQNTKQLNGIVTGGSYLVNTGLHSLPNGNRSSGSLHSRDPLHSLDGSNKSMPASTGLTGEENGMTPSGLGPASSRHSLGDKVQAPSTANGISTPAANGRPIDSITSLNPENAAHATFPPSSPSSPSQVRHRRAISASNTQGPPNLQLAHLDPIRSDAYSPQHIRSSFPPIYPASTPAPASSTSTLQHPAIPRLQHRHTLQVPRATTTRGSRDFSFSNGDATDEGFSSSVSPTTASARRGSLSLARRTTRSMHSDLNIDEIPQDGEVARWTETVRQKRASRRKRKEDEEDDRVLVGTKVDPNHANWITAYNMLTGIRFTVSRTNAKLDRELTDQDFDARHKFSFDITGNELTPSARYDFKFKDYAPWVFRHLRAKFKLDPADYLISLTSKYILSELGSPGKSGSFFYFSRDYKYIIKTIHHAEHKLLRKILRDYYAHVQHNPNTLISQFYGLHRVKVPYGRKIHFVVMNNLFPPHRDIHQTFDLKGSTIGRDFKEEELVKNPRATLKDLNWLRRNYHLEFGADKKRIFIEQMKKDVALLQKLKIMDYSLLVGIHDLGKGNEEKLRDKTLQVFQPGGERNEEPQPSLLTRTPSKLENARKARELRQLIKKEKPVPMEKSTFQMPEEIVETRSSFLFYSDDGGFRASHADGQPGEEIYYLGIIDCLTHVRMSFGVVWKRLTQVQYGLIKKAEHLWKGMSSDKTQISPISPEPYGDRFVRFITGITMPREEAEKKSQDTTHGGSRLIRSSTDKMMDKAEHEARHPESNGSSGDEPPDRTISVVRSPSAEPTSGLAGATLPVVEEVGEGGSTGGRSGRSQERDEASNQYSNQLNGSGLPPIGGRPPPTPPKDHPLQSRASLDKQLPSLPPKLLPNPIPLTDSPAPLSPPPR
ncbi:Phosphatidylinositol-4-phosphate 5-kinase [Xylographa bjoerkii]|nr:Phosphatidylinositol-4-phosphate 5-kinase [Xylographa bjoerkii]